MSRISVFESSETGRTEVLYSSLSLRQIESRIKSYEKKYGMPFARYNSRFSCDEALPWEVADAMDWESLVQERKARQPRANGGKQLACGKR
jgi:hypothetical protein